MLDYLLKSNRWKDVNLVSKLQFNKVDITDTIVVIALAIGFIMSILYQMNELSMSVASGFFGYVGGTASANLNRKKEDEETKEKELSMESDIE